jgi:glycosyltransferase involved in cell wall biosynthesis
VKKVFYTVAHSGFNLGEVPLGGGASIAHHLTQQWTRTKPFDYEVLGPSILGSDAPRGKDLVRYSELDYARFCRSFEKKLTSTILQRDPPPAVVLSNDVSEGPDFKTLAEKGHPIYTIYHVDVVDYFTSIYLQSWVKPETTTALYRGLWRAGLSHLLPRMLNLIWKKQEESVLYSKGLIVPSQRMKEVLLSCYPGVDAARIHVLPWGLWREEINALDVEREKVAIKKQFPVENDSRILLTLSRISPEKGQDRLLKALALWEKQLDYPKEGISLFIAGESAYMMGKKYLDTLRRLAAKLKRSRVHFVGHVSGARKKAFFALADLYVFPSRHESYGLTLLEALQAGLPVLTTPSHGAQEVFQPGFGEMIPGSSEQRVPALLMNGLKHLLSDRLKLREMGKAASAWADQQKFSDTAGRLAQLLK